MTLITSIVYEDAAVQVVSDVDEHGNTSRRLEWKAGTPQFNQQQIVAKLDQAIAALDPNGTTWTGANQAARTELLRKVTRNLCRLARGQFDTAGE